MLIASVAFLATLVPLFILLYSQWSSGPAGSVLSPSFDTHRTRASDIRVLRSGSQLKTGKKFDNDKVSKWQTVTVALLFI